MNRSKRSIGILLVLLGYGWAGPSELHAQGTDTTHVTHMPPLVISAYKEKPLKESSLNVVLLTMDSLFYLANYNLTDALARIPGVTMLSTGPAIAKPVIRGLYGNRILVLLSGMKFDNQQWQDEHGLGLTDGGIDRAELIKGPLGVLYGTEAIGGIINLIEERKPAIQESETDFSLRAFSNTLGGSFQGGYKMNTGKRWFTLRAGMQNQADYSDGHNERVLNSRFDGYFLKVGYGFQHANWTSENRFQSSFNRFGFIFNDIYNFIDADERYSRKLNVNPDHLVLLNILSSENKIFFENQSVLNVHVGIQSNQRMENEGGGAISLNMQLLTFQYLLKWEQNLSTRNKLIISHLGNVETNVNYGARKIIPDALMQEATFSVYLESRIGSHLILENGVGLGEKWIKTRLTPMVNSEDNLIHPFSKFSPYPNLFTGVTFYPDDHWNFKLNLASGVRIPNLAELSSNGLHEGIFTYEIGSPDLKNETCISANLVASFLSDKLDFTISPFYTYFLDYVYLAPTDETWSGFPVYRYRQQDAVSAGTEAVLTVRTGKHHVFTAAYSGMVSHTRDGLNIPFTPAQKISPGISTGFATGKGGMIKPYTQADFYFDQFQIYPREIATPGYFLWDAGVTYSSGVGDVAYSVSLCGTNLLNRAYYDHLSRFKNYGLLNVGRTISVQINLKFRSSLPRT